MLSRPFALFSAALAIVVCRPAQGQFVNDEFNSGSLGPQWTFVDSTPGGSSSTLTGSAYRLTAAAGSDLFLQNDTQAYIQQNAPVGTNWEIVTKLDNFDPTAVGFRRNYNKTGIQLWQDNDHWLSIYVMSSGDGLQRIVEAVWQTDPTSGTSNNRYSGLAAYNGITTSPMFLKVVKTPRGYLGQMSGDGVTWINVLPVVRNPETVDGSLTAEKFRLFGTGGFGTGAPRPADFDYARTVSVTGPTASYTDDEFNGTSLNSSLWSFYEGVEKGTVSVGAGNLTLLPGFRQDQWEHVERAMHIYQDAPTSNSFEVITKLSGPNDLRPFEQWNGYGMMLWQDQCNWIMISAQRSDTITNRVEVGYKRAGLYDVVNVDFGTALLPNYLQIQKNGSRYTARYSYDNVTWSSAPNGGFVYPAPLKNAQVRLHSKRVFGPGDAQLGTAAAAQFDWVHSQSTITAAPDWYLFE